MVIEIPLKLVILTGQKTHFGLEIFQETFIESESFSATLELKPEERDSIQMRNTQISNHWFQA